jgi:hypothetical protein
LAERAKYRGSHGGAPETGFKAFFKKRIKKIKNVWRLAGVEVDKIRLLDFFLPKITKSGGSPEVKNRHTTGARSGPVHSSRNFLSP